MLYHHYLSSICKVLLHACEMYLAFMAEEHKVTRAASSIAAPHHRIATDIRQFHNIA